jgi:glycerophosphoryl diester phosphodiesterase
MTFAELRVLDAGKGERAPALEEVLEVCRDRVTLLIEQKGPGTEGPTMRIVEQAAMIGQAVLIGFDVDRIAGVKRADPRFATGVIFGKPPADAVRRACVARANWIDVHYKNLTRALVQEAHSHGLLARGWTPDTEADIRRTIAFGVDAVTSNRPDVLLKVIRRAQRR